MHGRFKTVEFDRLLLFMPNPMKEGSPLPPPTSSTKKQQNHKDTHKQGLQINHILITWLCLIHKIKFTAFYSLFSQTM